MSRALKVAILGGGMIGEVHRRAALLAGGELVGVMSSSHKRSRELAVRWSAGTAFESLDQVADSGVDVVHICTPNSTHVPYAVVLMRAGKHVVCEKPLGTSLGDATTALDASEASGVVNVVPFAYRYHPMVREMRSRIGASSFGAVNLIHGSYLQDWMLDPAVNNWRVDSTLGGPSRAFADIGSHWCDLAEWVTRDRITSLVATTTIAVPRRAGAASQRSFSGGSRDAPLVEVFTEDTALILFRTARGIAGSATISQVAAGRKNRLWLEVDGAHHSAVFDQEDAEHLWIGSASGGLVLNRDPSQGSPEQRRLSTLPAGHAQGYAQCFEGLVQDTYTAVLEGEAGAPEGLPTFADGRRAVALGDAVLTSARTGTWVHLDAPPTDLHEGTPS